MKKSLDYNKLSDEDKLELGLLQHAKSNVISKSGERSQALEKALKNYSEPAPNLYRGLYKEEVSQMGKLQAGKVFTFGRYTSFSENLETARRFGGDTKIIMFLKGGEGFNYSKYMIKYLNSLDMVSFEIMRGEELMASLKSEKEWILPIAAKYRIDNIKASGEYTVIGCSMA